MACKLVLTSVALGPTPVATTRSGRHVGMVSALPLVKSSTNDLRRANWAKCDTHAAVRCEKCTLISSALQSLGPWSATCTNGKRKRMQTHSATNRMHLEICLARFLAVGATKLHSCRARLCSCCKCSSDSGDSLSAHIHSGGGSACRKSPRLRNSFTRRRAMMRFATCRSWASTSTL